MPSPQKGNYCFVSEYNLRSLLADPIMPTMAFPFNPFSILPFSFASHTIAHGFIALNCYENTRDAQWNEPAPVNAIDLLIARN